MSAVVAQLYRYPVKGLSAEALSAAVLRPGHGLPLDRAFALAPATTGIDPIPSEWVSKSHFVTLVRHERLAALDSRYDAAKGVLALYRNGRRVAQGAIATPIGRAMIEEFFRAYLRNELPAGRLGYGAHAFRPARAGPVDHRSGKHQRSGTRCWPGCRSAALPRQHLCGGDGAVGGIQLGGTRDRGRRCPSAGEGSDRTMRCDRCRTRIRDLHIPHSLMGSFGHVDCGVFATVVAMGNVAIGDRVGPPGD